MTLSSFSGVFGLTTEHEGEETIAPNDLVRSGNNFMPHFRVVAVDGDEAWVRDHSSGVSHLAPLNRFHKVNGPIHYDPDAAT